MTGGYWYAKRTSENFCVPRLIYLLVMETTSARVRLFTLLFSTLRSSTS